MGHCQRRAVLVYDAGYTPRLQRKTVGAFLAVFGLTPPDIVLGVPSRLLCSLLLLRRTLPLNHIIARVLGGGRTETNIKCREQYKKGVRQCVHIFSSTVINVLTLDRYCVSVFAQ